MSERQTGGGDDLVACEITGKPVPESETVMFRGKRVSAEGKAVLLERLAAGEVIPGELERPTFWMRTVSAIADNILVSLAFLALGAAVLGADVLDTFMGNTTSAKPGASLFFDAITSVLSIAYYTWMHARTGQTIGKHLGKIKVVKSDGSPLDLHVALLRSLYLFLPNVVGSAVLHVGRFVASDMMISIGTVLTFVASFYLVSGIIVAMIDRDKQRAIHDHLAGTRVIRVG